MGTVLGIIAIIALIANVVLWVISLIKEFKAGDIVWGVLTILFGIPGIIYFFMKGHKQLGIYWIIALIVYMVAAGMGLSSMGGIIPAAT